MSQLGLGVMMNMLAGDEDTAQAVGASLGKTIESVRVVDNQAIITFTDNSVLTLWDDGQSCCEHRYMSCADYDLPTFKGANLISVEVVDGGQQDKDYNVHEIQFLNIVTSLGTIQVANHNEHNGYYGGFSIAAKKRSKWM